LDGFEALADAADRFGVGEAVNLSKLLVIIIVVAQFIIIVVIRAMLLLRRCASLQHYCRRRLAPTLIV
jgi:hypothetical protein